MEKPVSFFKFVSFERQDILAKGMIRFAPIGEFNDPFELEPVITPYSRDYLNYLMSLTERERQLIEFGDKDLDYSYDRTMSVEKYRKLYKERISKYGILSLSSNCEINPLLAVCIPEKKDPRTNILMWSHYADSHKGLVIEFDNDFIPEIEIHKVEYSSDRDFLTFEDIDDNDFHKVFYKKSKEWGYEQEYRAVLPLSKALEVKDNKYHLFNFNKKCIRSITFGCAMNQENKDIIVEMIKKDDEFGKIQFNHALLNDDDFCLNFYHTTPSGWTNNPNLAGAKSILYQKE